MRPGSCLISSTCIYVVNTSLTPVAHTCLKVLIHTAGHVWGIRPNSSFRLKGGPRARGRASCPRSRRPWRRRGARWWRPVARHQTGRSPCRRGPTRRVGQEKTHGRARRLLFSAQGVRAVSMVSAVTLSAEPWKAVVPSTSAYGHGPRPSPCLLSRSRPCLLVAFTPHRTSAIARGPDPHDRRLIV